MIYVWIDVLTINDEEARLLSGVHSLRKAAKIILEMGPKYLIIKKGEHGALLFGDNNIFYAPALPLEEVFDPTGAGDTFAGGFVGHLSSCDTIDWEAMKKAIIVLLILLIAPTAKAQLFSKERILNRANIDKKTLSWGYYLGFNNYDYYFKRDKNFFEFLCKN